ncbi:hypothetical protein [Massilia horti]|uniref:hypothetical protein n=1 Tax=Massilia horti TaxID=2562153 RepID=UPI00197F9368|nr:hypothetical protein [Massilia horti]
MTLAFFSSTSIHNPADMARQPPQIKNSALLSPASRNTKPILVFVVIPQICSGFLLGTVTRPVFNGHTIRTLVLGGASMILAALLTTLVTDKSDL